MASSKAYMKRYRAENKDRIKAQEKISNARYYQENKVDLRKKHKEYWERTKEQQSFRRAENLYGISPDEYQLLLETQNGRCGICGTDDPGAGHSPYLRFVVDHDHETDEVRGLLCNRCNLAIGQFDDSADLMVSALLYLLRGEHSG